jgi:hypothetical protein
MYNSNKTIKDELKVKLGNTFFNNESYWCS